MCAITEGARLALRASPEVIQPLPWFNPCARCALHSAMPLDQAMADALHHLSCACMIGRRMLDRPILLDFFSAYSDETTVFTQGTKRGSTVAASLWHVASLD